MNLLKVLIDKNTISQEDAKSVRTEADKKGISFEEVLIKRGIIDSSDIAKIKSEYLDIPLKNVYKNIPKEILRYVPEESAKYYKVVPLGINEGILEIGAVNPDSVDIREALNFVSNKSGLPYKIHVISTEDFEKILAMYRGLKGEVKEALSELEDELQMEKKEESNLEDKVASGAAKEKSKDKDKEVSVIEDAPITKIVATILRYAVDGDASDVHVEPGESKVQVRFRVDGILNTSLILPIKVHPAVTARIKILSSMKLDEKRKPQDGNFAAKIEDRRIDFRVSTFPTNYGEKVVMRILDQAKGVKGLDDIGLNEFNLKTLKEGLKKPYGLILISGPTGSGKSTTLYSMLKEVDRNRSNVLSLEDPVEYNIEGVSQSQVRSDIGYTFATGLRTILRQDPDIIMVGEIRDKETAQLAIQAALTGHLVFSTIHTNNAIGVIPRLIDMGVDPYLIAPTLVMAISQRLVRILCAKKDVPVEGSIQAIIEREINNLPEEYKNNIKMPEKVYEAGSSPSCPSGVKGRMAVMEILNMNKKLEEVILKNPGEHDIEKVARENGMLSIRQDALLKAIDGLIPFSEVNAL